MLSLVIHVEYQGSDIAEKIYAGYVFFSEMISIFITYMNHQRKQFDIYISIFLLTQ